jgi:hypothetical protein
LVQIIVAIIWILWWAMISHLNLFWNIIHIPFYYHINICIILLF